MANEIASRICRATFANLSGCGYFTFDAYNNLQGFSFKIQLQFVYICKLLHHNICLQLCLVRTQAVHENTVKICKLFYARYCICSINFCNIKLANIFISCMILLYIDDLILPLYSASNYI